MEKKEGWEVGVRSLWAESQAEIHPFPHVLPLPSLPAPPQAAALLRPPTATETNISKNGVS